MADVKFEVTRVALSTAAAGNTQDITISGFGTPKAAIFLATYASTDDSIASNVAISIGFADGTNEACVSNVASDTLASSSTSRRHTTNRVFQRGATTEFDGFSFNSWITDGVRLDIDSQTTTAFLLTVVLIGGSDVSSALVGSLDDLGTGTSAIDVNTVGFEPDLVFMSQVGLSTAVPAGGIEAILSFGVAHNDGSDTQRCVQYASQGAQTNAVVNSSISNNKISGQIYGDTDSYGVTIGSFDASGFSLTPSANAFNDIVFYLCLKFTNSPDISLFDMSWPTSGSYAETGPGFTPNFGLIASAVGPSSRNTMLTSGGSAISIAAFDGGGVYTNTISDYDGQTNMVAKSLSSDQLRILDSDGSTDAVVASSYAFDSSGWDFTLSTNPASAVLGWGLAIGPGTTTTSLWIPDPRWEEPNLLIPGKKPTGPVVVDWSHPLLSGREPLAIVLGGVMTEFVTGTPITPVYNNAEKISAAKGGDGFYCGSGAKWAFTTKTPADAANNRKLSIFAVSTIISSTQSFAGIVRSNSNVNQTGLQTWSADDLQMFLANTSVSSGYTLTDGEVVCAYGRGDRISANTIGAGGHTFPGSSSLQSGTSSAGVFGYQTDWYLGGDERAAYETSRYTEQVVHLVLIVNDYYTQAEFNSLCSNPYQIFLPA